MNFIPDKEISLQNAEEDKLGTKIYADTITKVISEKTDDSPLTIGLFGGWGSGKSSIVKTVKDSLEKDGSIKTMIYDAWKYSNDAFRRSFILEFKKAFNLEITDELKSFYADKNEEIQHRVVFKKKWWIHLIIWLPILTLFIWATSYTTVLQIIISILGLFVTGLGYLVKSALTEYKISLTSSKFFSPEQFEEVFQEGLNILINPKPFSFKWFSKIINPSYKADKVVIIFDNIDRCHKDLAKELLLTIKNFLNCKNCIFIVPIDDEAIINHLGYRNEEGEEFLRKFFNVSIRIKKYSVQDLFDYTKNLICLYKLDFSDTVAFLISKEFSKNPRRIIQFLNNLVCEREIAIKQEKMQFVTDGTISNNIDFLAKILIIKEEWPEFYNRLNYNFYLLKEINEAIRENKFVFNNTQNIWGLRGKDISSTYHLSSNLYDFLKNTISIWIENIEPFIRIKDFDKDIPDDILEFIDKQKWNNIKEYIIKGDIKLEIVLNYIYKKLDLYNKSRLHGIAVSPLLNLVFEIMCDKEYKNNFGDYFKRFQDHIENDNIKFIIGSFTIDNLLQVTKKRKPQSSYLLGKVAEYINTTSSEKLIIAYIEKFEDDHDALQRINNAFTRLFEKDLSLIDKYEHLFKRKNINDKLLTNDFIYIIINSIENKNVDGKDSYKIKIIKLLNEYDNITDEQLSHYVNKILEYCNTNDKTILIYQLENMKGFIEKLKNKDISQNVFIMLNQRNEHFYSAFYSQSQRDKNTEKTIVLIMELLTEYVVNSNKPFEINNILIKYLAQNSNKEHYLKANESLRKIIEHYETHNWEFVNNFTSKFMKLNGDDRIDIGNTMVIMLKKTKMKEGELIGMTEQDIKDFLNLFFNTFFSLPEENNYAQKWLSESLSNNLIKPYFFEKIKEYKKPEDIKRIISFGKYIEDSIFISNMIDISLKTAKNYNELNEIIVSINKNEIKDRNDYIRKSLINILNETNISQKEYLKDIIKCCIDHRNIFTIENNELITNNIIGLFSTKEKEDEDFALNCLNNFKQIPKSKKTLIEENIKLLNIDHEEVKIILKKLNSNFAE